jgi:hypothetical protein
LIHPWISFILAVDIFTAGVTVNSSQYFLLFNYLEITEMWKVRISLSLSLSRLIWLSKCVLKKNLINVKKVKINKNQYNS